jgi:hypothetical protein
MIKTFVKNMHRLRIFFLIYIIAGSLVIGNVNPIDIGKFIGAKFGSAVGMSVSVPENPFNKLAVQLKEKEADLAQKEQDLNAREQALNNHNNPLMIVLVIGIGVLFVLILLNYYLDYRRRRQERLSAEKKE